MSSSNSAGRHRLVWPVGVLFAGAIVIVATATRIVEPIAAGVGMLVGLSAIGYQWWRTAPDRAVARGNLGTGLLVGILVATTIGATQLAIDSERQKAADLLHLRTTLFPTNLAGYPLNDLNLTEFVLVDKVLKGASFERTKLVKANLERSNLRGANFASAKLRQAKLSGADLTRAVFREADLRDADLRGGTFRQADLRAARLVNAHLEGACLRDASLPGADLHGAHLAAADLGGAVLDIAELASADLLDASLRRPKTDLHDADLRFANLRRANLSSANLHNADLSGTDLRKANLRLADLRGADLRGAHLRGAMLRGARLRGAMLLKQNLRAIPVNLRDGLRVVPGAPEPPQELTACT